MLKLPLNIIGWTYQREASSPATTRNVFFARYVFFYCRKFHYVEEFDG